MSRRYGDLDYARLTKLSFLLGVGMLVGAELGEFGLRTAGVPVPPWEHTVFLLMGGAGIVVALLTPFIFGILLPLTE